MGASYTGEACIADSYLHTYPCRYNNIILGINTQLEKVIEIAL